MKQPHACTFSYHCSSPIISLQPVLDRDAVARSDMLKLLVSTSLRPDCSVALHWGISPKESVSFKHHFHEQNSAPSFPAGWGVYTSKDVCCSPNVAFQVSCCCCCCCILLYMAGWSVWNHGAQVHKLVTAMAYVRKRIIIISATNAILHCMPAGGLHTRAQHNFSIIWALKQMAWFGAFEVLGYSLL